MKRMMILLAGAMAVMCSFGDSFWDEGLKEEVNGLTWTYVVENGEATIYGYAAGFGIIKDHYPAIPKTTTGPVTIPNKLGGCLVTAISSYAFWYCDGITSLVIPSGVRSIGSEAFRGCTGLTSVSIPSSVTSIGAGAFSSCSALESVMIPSGVTEIYDSTFGGCAGLTSVVIPSSVTSIGYNAFINCSGLTSLVIQDGVTSIGYRAFERCSSLTSVVIPESVTSIDGRAFYDCVKLASVSIPSKLISVGGDAFAACPNFLNVIIATGNTYKIRGGKLMTAGGSVIIDWPLQSTVLSSQIRANDPTIMDITYRVRSLHPAVKVRVLAFEDGQRSFAKVVRPETFVDGTGVNVGDAITPNVEHKISWRVSSDWQTKLAKVKFEVLASEGELLPLETMTIPASNQYGKMKITFNTITANQLFDALLWLYADRDASLELGNGNLYTRVGGYYSPLVSGSTVRYGDDYIDIRTDREVHEMGAHEYVFQKMGYSLLTGAPLAYANQETRLGLSPSGARQYGYKIVE